MAKKARTESRFKIDRLPSCVQQPRSPPRKRRTDFSLFFCSSDSNVLKAIPFLEKSNSKDALSTITVANLDERKDIMHVVPKSFEIQCSVTKAGGRSSLSISSEASIIDTGSATKDKLCSTSYPRNYFEQSGDIAEALEIIPMKSHRSSDGNEAYATPGSIVWAKRASELWWPAEIMEGRLSSANSGSEGVDGLVFVQYFGDEKRSWVDPATDLSEFNKCFEAGSRNQMEDFQDALQLALRRKEMLNPCGRLFGSSNEHKCSSQLGEASADKWNSSSSSRSIEDAVLEKGRGKRKRKPRIHFDDATLPPKLTRKGRRFRIMRCLGLAAPAGSPF